MAYNNKVRLPEDEEDPRFTQSFSIDQEAEIKEFFAQYGVVVVRDVLSEEECQASVQEMIEFIEANSQFRYQDPSTWHHWPNGGIESFGQCQREPYFFRTFMNNRQNENVHRVFALIYNIPKEQLLVNFDRGCLFRPTKDITYPDGNVRTNMKLQTRANVHLDLNPWEFLKEGSTKAFEELSKLRYGNKLSNFIYENNQVHQSMYDGPHLQAGINLIENEISDGGFVCVPGFANHFERWAADNSKSAFVDAANSVAFPDNHILQDRAQRVSMRAGSMVIWDQRTPHGSFGNRSSRFRSAQFLKVFPNNILEMQPNRKKARANTLRRIIRDIPGFELTPLGRHVFGLD